VFSSRVRLFATLLAIGVTLAPSLGAAQGRNKRADDACSPDFRRLCREFDHKGDMVILQCFKQHRASLSAACRKYLVEVGALN
jgi:hypothetical protein